MPVNQLMSRSWLEKKADRVWFYAGGAARDCLPAYLYRRKLEAFYKSIDRTGLRSDLVDRVNYYCKFRDTIDLTGALPVSDMKLDNTYSYYDFRRFAHYFGDNVRFRWKFGDIRRIVEMPTLVKSRPLLEGNENNIVFKLNSFRHFQWANDSIPFEAKMPRAVWRGDLNHSIRRTLVERYNASSLHDIGHTRRREAAIPAKPHVTMEEQLRSRYIISVEGNDVATNLKWIMSSNALCLMPRPRYETWYMEGTLKPGIHYVELRDDVSDLDEKIAFYEAHPEKALEIIAAANAYARVFRDNTDDERTTCLLVMQKYLELTGQIPARYFAAS